MANLTSGVARFVAEALIIIPALAMGLVWAGVTVAGLLDPSFVGRHLTGISRLMTWLLIACIGCFAGGFVLLTLTRGRRRNGP
jgi:hypothetical protein